MSAPWTTGLGRAISGEMVDVVMCSISMLVGVVTTAVAVVPRIVVPPKGLCRGSLSISGGCLGSEMHSVDDDLRYDCADWRSMF